MADETTAVPAPEATETEQATPITGGKPTIDVKVYAPFNVYYEGAAYSLSATNETGPFDIMPHHHNFLCMLVPGTLAVQTPDGEKTFKLPKALLHVKADRVDVFVDV